MEQLTPEPLLIADPDADDVSRLRQSLSDNSITNPVQFVTDGAQLHQYLQRQGSYADQNRFPLPSLVLMEWDLPHKSALDILHWTRDHPQYSMLPILIWTRASVADAQLKEAYQSGLNGFFIKPKGIEELNSLTRLVFDYWRLAEKPLMRVR
jgi:CheY-like chemotaxis protein